MTTHTQKDLKNEKELVQAARKGDEILVRRILAREIWASYTTHKQALQAALIEAVEGGNVPVTKALLEAGATTDPYDYKFSKYAGEDYNAERGIDEDRIGLFKIGPFQTKPFAQAFNRWQNKWRAIKLPLEVPASPLDRAVQKNDVEIVRVLLESYTYPTVETLTEAIEVGNPEIVGLLIKRGLPHYENHRGETKYQHFLIRESARKGNLEILGQFLAAFSGFDPDKNLAEAMLSRILSDFGVEDDDFDNGSKDIVNFLKKVSQEETAKKRAKVVAIDFIAHDLSDAIRIHDYKRTVRLVVKLEKSLTANPGEFSETLKDAFRIASTEVNDKKISEFLSGWLDENPKPWPF